MRLCVMPVRVTNSKTQKVKEDDAENPALTVSEFWIPFGNGAAVVVSGFFFTKTAERDSDPYTAKGGRLLN